VVYLTDGDGEILRKYRYTGFGAEINSNPDDENPFRYGSEYFDQETGQIYLRARYYNPKIGRFTQKDTHWNMSNMLFGDRPRRLNNQPDPMGLRAYSYRPDVLAVMQSSNLYAYVMSSPLLYSDPTGRFAQPNTKPVSIDGWSTSSGMQKAGGFGGADGGAGKFATKATVKAMNAHPKVVKAAKSTRLFITSNKGSRIDITPSMNHSIASGNPIKGVSNSSVDILGSNGNIRTRRWFDQNGNQFRTCLPSKQKQRNKSQHSHLNSI
jgi:RHS repeat-associated protein